MLDLEKLEGLVKIMEDSSLNTMSIKDGDFKITMSKLDNPPVLANGSMVSAVSALPSEKEEAASSAGSTAADTDVHIVSPIVGTF